MPWLKNGINKEVIIVNNRFHTIKNKIYFIPGYYALMGTVLSLILILLDNYYADLLQNFIPIYMFTSVDLAKTILSTLAGSLFGMITISFSTIMVVLTMYSSQFSPRTMQDFLHNKVTLKVLGIFIGGFIYTIITLLFLRNEGADKVVFTAVMGVIIAIVCLAYFVYFIHHVANSVQVNLLIEKLRDEIIQIVDKIEERTDKNEQIRNDAPEDMNDILSGDSYYIYSKKNGFIQHIYEIKLAKLANNKNIIIRAEKMIGDYVTKNSKLFSIWPQETEHKINFEDNNQIERNVHDLVKEDNNKPKVPLKSSKRELENEEEEVIEIDNAEKFLDFVVIGNERSKNDDIEFGLLKLTEVALKAISPGINDPNTAIFCINQLGLVMSRIAVSGIENTYHYNEEGHLRLILEDITFKELLYKTFFQICHYGREDVSVAGSILDALLIIAEGSPQEIKDQVWDFTSYVLGSFDEDVLQTEDKRFLNHKLARLARETDNRKDYEYFQIN